MRGEDTVDIFRGSEVKPVISLFDSQLYLDNKQFPSFRRDRSVRKGGKVLFMKRLLLRRITNFESLVVFF